MTASMVASTGLLLMERALPITFPQHHPPHSVMGIIISRGRGDLYTIVLMDDDVLTENDLNSETTASHRINHKCTLYKDINDHIKSSHLCQSVVVSLLL